jgi:hypothetical protein
MSVDKFGRHSINATAIKLLREKPDVTTATAVAAFPLTSTGNYNVKKKRLCNVGNPVEQQDAATKVYVDNLGIALDTRIGSCLALKNDVFEINKKRLVNVSLPQEANDAASKQYVDHHLQRIFVSFQDTLKKLDGRLQSVEKNIHQQQP